MQIQKITVDIENGKFRTGFGGNVIALVKVKSWNALDFNFEQVIDLDSFESQFDRFMEMARRAIHAEITRIKADQLPEGKFFESALEEMKRRNATGKTGVPRA